MYLDIYIEDENGERIKTICEESKIEGCLEDIQKNEVSYLEHVIRLLEDQGHHSINNIDFLDPVDETNHPGMGNFRNTNNKVLFFYYEKIC